MAKLTPPPVSPHPPPPATPSQILAADAPDGWLSTKQVAEAVGLARRQFQEYTRTHDLTRVKLNGRPGAPCFYDPAVVEQVRQDLAPPAAPAATGPEEAAVMPEPAKIETSGTDVKAKPTRRPPARRTGGAAVDKTDSLRPELYQQAMSIMDRIVQNIGRMG